MQPNVPSNRPWSGTIVPERVRRLPRMLSDDENRYLIWLTENRYEGWGHVLDLGCWLGSSSACLAEGLHRAGKRGFVTSMDLFVWDASYMDRDADFQLADGSDFLPRFCELTAPWGDRIVPQRVDLLDFRWSGEPVEILFVDAAKSWQLTNAILGAMAAAIVPGRTRVVFQDFRLPKAPWLPLLVGSRPDLWREVENTTDGTTVTFEAIRPLVGTGGIDTRRDVDSFSFLDAERILRARIASDPDGAHLYRQTLLRAARLWGSERDADVARDELLDEHGIAASAELEDVSADVMLASWAATERGDHAHAIELAQRCRRIAPGATLALGPLGFAHLARGELAEAATALEELLRLRPDRQDHHLYVANLRTRQGRHREAFAILERVVPELAAEPTRADHVLTLLERIADGGRMLPEAVGLARAAPPAVRTLPRWRDLLAAFPGP